MKKTPLSLSLIALFCAVSLILSWIDSMVPLPMPIAGVRLGIANIPILILILAKKPRSAFFIAITKCLISSLLFGNPTTFLYSLSGTLLSFFIMLFLGKFHSVPTWAIGVFGAIFHSVGQVGMGILLISPSMLYYLPFLICAALITGVLTGLLSAEIYRRCEKIFEKM